ncbi:MAG: glutathione S-transferase N-terminal domain-containing protein [Alphaproteobacteria bacterium]|nr:glutathione S-transferase N-terminal domain-containing protein [Alphaproteobacteria bacterium]MBV8413524.1 glutathione S-transferase N-terminal domain-containing protein [Alphaproteobacteria bacterium]
MLLYVTPASPWVRRVVVSILELGLRDRFEFVQTKWPHSWATHTVNHSDDFAQATPVQRIPALVAGDLCLVESHAICDYINGELGGFRLLARDGEARWQALADIAIANGTIEAQIARRAELLRSESERSSDFIDKMRARTLRCFSALDRRVNAFDADFDLAQITIAVACGYQEWRYPADGWRVAAPRLAAWFDGAAGRLSMRATEPAETPQA